MDKSKTKCYQPEDVYKRAYTWTKVTSIISGASFC